MAEYGISSIRAFDYQWLIWRVYGLHRPEGNTFWARHYLAYSIVYNLIFNGWVPLSLYLGCFTSNDIVKFSESFYLSTLVAVEQLKFANVWRVRGQLKRLHEILDHLDGRLRRDAERQIIRKHDERTKMIFLWLLRLFILILASAALFVLCNAEEELPFPGWYPWNYRSSRPIHLLTCTLQILSISSLALMTLNNDTYPVSYLTMVAAQYRALALRISLLGYGLATREQAYQQLIECIRDHKSILM